MIQLCHLEHNDGHLPLVDALGARAGRTWDGPLYDGQYQSNITD